MNADQTLARIRASIDRLNRTTDVDSPYRLTLDLFTDLDAYLSAGGTPPEAWGPDAPDIDLGPVGPNGEPWGWQESDATPPPPEGLAVFAHWSRVHDGINVEIDAPEGLPVTVHVNDWEAVNVVIGTDRTVDDGSDCPDCGMHVDRCPVNGEHEQRAAVLATRNDPR